MTKPAWTSVDPDQPGFYYAVPIEHPQDEARADIAAMASGWLADPRPLLLVAEVGLDDEDETEDPKRLIPFFAGVGEYAFADLAHDFARVWWYGPLDLPPAIPGLGPIRAPGECGQRRFSVPEAWPPEE